MEKVTFDPASVFHDFDSRHSWRPRNRTRCDRRADFRYGFRSPFAAGF